MIYLVEDDANIRELVTYTLNHSGLDATGFERPSQFWKAMEGQLPDLVLLDIMLPEEDGLSILRRLRAAPATASIPILLVSAKNSEYDKVMGLDNGADDYLAKPFGMMELVARAKALLRRTAKRSAGEEFRLGMLYVSLSKHLVMVEGEEVTLTNKEFSLLTCLLQNQGRVLTRDRAAQRHLGLLLRRGEPDGGRPHPDAAAQARGRGTAHQDRPRRWLQDWRGTK